MNKFLTTVALVPLLVASPVLAADFVEPIEEMPIVDEAVSDWNGFYTGVHIGAGVGNRHGCLDDFDFIPDDCFTDPEFDYNLSGFLLGTQAGFNFALNESFVVGVEVSGSFTNISGFVDPDFEPLGEGSYNWITTGTARAGWTNEMFMIYGEAGVALAGFEFEGLFCDFETTATGGVLGLGAEVMVAENVSLFGEWNRVFLQQQSNNCDFFFAPDLTAHTQGHLDLFKVGLNAHF
jgi:outer membrane immunogenic protein